ncbi:VanW family protein [Patescibacteria group bacterium]|nr:VanW family protein [Patescibacteria group bacterium]
MVSKKKKIHKKKKTLVQDLKENIQKVSANLKKHQQAKKEAEEKRLREEKMEKLKEELKNAIANKIKGTVIAASIIVAILVAFQFSSMVIKYELAGKALPGTRIAGMDVGMMTLDEIQGELMAKGQPFLDAKIQMSLGDLSAEFSPYELGIQLLPRYTLQEVKFVEVDGMSIFEVLSEIWNDNEIPFYVSVDIDTAINNIEKKFDFAQRKAKNAHFGFDENDDLIVLPGEIGEEIDMRGLYQTIKESANKLSSAPIIIETQSKDPIVTTNELEAQKEKIAEILKQTISLSYENWDWDVKLINHIDWVDFTYQDSVDFNGVITLPLEISENATYTLSEFITTKKQLAIKINEQLFNEYIDEEISSIIEVEPGDVLISMDENGEIIIEGQGKNGRTIKRDFFVDAFVLAINQNLNEVPIPVQERKANVEVSENLKMLGIESLIGTGRSAFVGSTANRVHNISVGVERFNGTLIPPGQIFSFNERLGPVDASTGYLPELVIKPEGTIKEYGGGLCQVSSTMYRAAIFSGLPIVERTPHSYAVSYYAQIYGYGLDASIYIGVLDLKFENDTGGYILVQAYTEGTNAYFKFYGTDDGRSVEMEGPYLGGYRSPGAPVVVQSSSLAPGQSKQVESAHTGFNATWYRYLTKGGETVKEPIYSTYKAIPARILVGPSAAPVEEE